MGFVRLALWVLIALMFAGSGGAARAQTVQHLFSFGGSGSADGQFNQPQGVAFADAGNIYVADSYNHRIQKFDVAGGHILSFGSFGTSDGQFDQPFGVTLDGAGNIYVGDTKNSRIQKFDAQGNHLLSFGSFGTADGQFNQLNGVAVDSAGNIYATDRGNHRVQKFDATGNHLLSFGTLGTADGQFDNPIGATVDGVGNIYVADLNNHRIQKFDAGGNHLLSIGSFGTANGQFNLPSDVAVDRDGRIYVADHDNHRIQLFDAAGNHLLSFGSLGTADGQFNSPTGIAVDGAGKIYVGDRLNHRIQVFSQTSPEPPRILISGSSTVKAEGDTGTTPFQFEITRTGDTSGTSSVQWSVVAFVGGPSDPANGADFGGVFPSGSVTFAAGVTTQTIFILVSGDTDVEPDEGFAVVLSNPTGATIALGDATGAIINDDLTPPVGSTTTISIVAVDSAKAEGNSGATAFQFDVNRSGDTSGTSSVQWAVAGSGANPADAADFGGTLPSGTVNLAAGVTTQTITIAVLGDTDIEPDEGFTVTLSNPTGATISTGAATGTITNDDSQQGTVPTNVMASDGAFADKITVTWNAVSDATSYEVYRSTSANGTKFLIGSPTIASFEDTDVQAGDIFFYSVKAVTAAGLSDFSAPDQGSVGSASAPPSISITAVSTTKSEGNSGITTFQFDVNRSGDTSGTSSVQWAVAGSGANPADATDFAGALPSGIVNFAAGVASQTITINVFGDTDVEPDEGFSVTLSNPTGATLSTTTATGTITNDDEQLPNEVNISAVSAINAEGDSGITSFTFSVTRTGDTSISASVDWFATGTGDNPADLADFGGTQPSGTINFAIGETEKVFKVNIPGDTDVEPNEEFTVTLTNPTGAAIGIRTATGTILNDDVGGGNVSIPTAPTGISASDDTFEDKIRVTWNAVNGATSYSLVRSTESRCRLGDNCVEFTGLTSTTFDDTTADPGITYWYWVRAINSAGTGLFGVPPDTGRRDTGASIPTAPTGISASDDTFEDKIRVTWNAVSGATSYSLVRSTESRCRLGDNCVEFTGLTSATFDDTTAEAGITYRYWVRAINSAGTGLFGVPPDTGRRAVAPNVSIPTAPTGISASDDTFEDRIQVIWNAVNGATSYSLVRSTSTSCRLGTNCVEFTGLTSTTFDDTTAEAGITYRYWVRAINSAGTGLFGVPPDTGRRGTDIPIPTAPTGISASDDTFEDKIRVTWNAVSGATSYSLVRSTASSCRLGTNCVEFTGLTSTTFDDTSAEVGITYRYWVRAINSAGTGLFGVPPDIGRRGTGVSIPTAPTGISASDDTFEDKIRVTWNAVNGATSYSLARSTSTSCRLGTNCVEFTGLTSTTFDDTTADPGITYRYWVRAINSAGTGLFGVPPDTGRRTVASNVAVPDAPTGISASDDTFTDRVQVTWNAVSSAPSYSLVRATSQACQLGVNCVEFAGLASTTFDDTSAEPGVTYRYWVQGVNSGGKGPFGLPSDLGRRRVGSITLLLGFGSEGSADGQFRNPQDVAVDANRNIYVSDLGNNRIQKFDTAGNHLLSFGNEGSADGQFRNPHGITVDSAGNIYVVDQSNHRIQKFDATGGHLLSLGSDGSADGQFNIPSGVAVDIAGNIYVADSYNSRVQKFDANGNHLLNFEGDSSTISPIRITLDSAGNFYTTDLFDHVDKFDAAGNQLLRLGGTGTADGQFQGPRGIALDDAGNIYVADTRNNRIQKFDAAGNHLLSFGSDGTAGGQFLFPSGVAVDSSGNIYVMDLANERILVFGQSAPTSSSASFANDSVLSFGSPMGVFAYLNDATFEKISEGDPNKILVADIDGNGLDDVIADFGAGVGLWLRKNNAAWARFNVNSTTHMAAADLDNNGSMDILTDFGAGVGTWVHMNDATWEKFNTNSTGGIIAGDMDGNGQTDVIVNLGVNGTWGKMNNTTWVKHNVNASDRMLLADLDGNGMDELIMDFGNPGVWAKRNNSTWERINANTSEGLAAGDIDGDGKQDLIVDLGVANGLWARVNDGTWKKLNPNSPNAMGFTDFDGNGKDDLVVDFGAGVGTWSYRNDADWVKVNANASRHIAGGQIDGQ